MYKLAYFYRKPQATYFSIEKLFQNISTVIASAYSQEFIVEEYDMPFASKLKTLYQNISFTKQHQAVVNHITGDVHYAVFGCSKKKINILTIHDCVALHRYPRKSLRYWFIKLLWYNWPVKKADIITVISENTRKELLHFTHCDPCKIRVIPNFVDPSFQYSPLTFHPEKPCILFIGTTPNKNLGRLIEALDGIPAILDIIGPLSQEQIEKLETYHIQYSQSERLSAEALLEKYRQSDMVAFPSTYEGFGLPIIEAQATGRPVLTSNLSPMKEVAGAGACLVNPIDTKSIREGILRIINNPSYREKLVEAGLQNVSRFRLDSIAAQYASLYKELLEKRKY